MWLFSTRGFFSVVKHAYEHGHLLVRARLREDIDQMARLLAEETGRPFTPQMTPEGDYLYRLDVPRADFARVLARLLAEVDYINFKTAAHGSPGRDQAYGRVWSIMAELQEDEALGR
jgi:hypothetical protein